MPDVWRSAVVPIRPALETSDGRTLIVKLAPWDQPATVVDPGGAGPYTEVLERGALVADPDRTVPVFAGHDPATGTRGPVIGRLQGTDDRDDGLYGTLRVADTSAGRDTLALLAEEITTGVSVEFSAPGQTRPGTEVRRAGPLPLTGVALVVHPAYSSAQVLATRSEPMTMTDVPPTDPDPEPVPDPDPAPEAAERARAAAARSAVPRVAAPAALVPARPRFESYGAFVADTAHGAMRGEVDPFADTVYRALADEVVADVPGLIREAWVGDVKGLLDLARPTVQAFSTAPLPKGDPIAWAEITDLPPVGKQATEKSEVVSGKLSIAKRTTDIVTYGGAQDVSIQVITRSQPSYIDILMRAFAKQMAVAMNTAAVAYVDAGITTVDVDLGSDPVAWVSALADADAQVFANVGVPPDVLVAGLNIRKAFLGASDADGRPLFGGLSPVNNIGTLSLGDTSGNVRGMSVVFDPALDPDTGYLGWSGSFNTYLSPVGNLQVDNPGQLGRDIAVYQMAAFALFYPKGIVKLTMPAPPVIPLSSGTSSAKK